MILSGGIKKIKRRLQMMFHPDKSPHGKPNAPLDIPEVAAYKDAFASLNEPVLYLEGWMSLYLPR